MARSAWASAADSISTAPRASAGSVAGNVARGGGSSMTAWPFVPLKPKLLTPARRTRSCPRGHGIGASRARSPDDAQSNKGVGWRR
jgi:hypothetical protein